MGAIRFYVDADLLGLAHIMAGARTDVTYPGDPGGIGRDGRQRPVCDITPETKEPVWIPVVADRGRIVITKDISQGRSPRMRALIEASAARHIALTTREKFNIWAQLEIVLCSWRRIEAAAAAPGPWMYSATRTGLRKLF